MEITEEYSIFLLNILSKRIEINKIYKKNILYENLDLYIDLINAGVIKPNHQGATKIINNFLNSIDNSQWIEKLSVPEILINFIFLIFEKEFKFHLKNAFFDALTTHAEMTINGKITLHAIHSKWDRFVSLLSNKIAYRKRITAFLLKPQIQINELFYKLYRNLILFPNTQNEYESIILNGFSSIIDNESSDKLEWLIKQISGNKIFIQKIIDLKLLDVFKNKIENHINNGQFAEENKRLLTLLGSN